MQSACGIKGMSFSAEKSGDVVDSYGVVTAGSVTRPEGELRVQKIRELRERVYVRHLAAPKLSARGGPLDWLGCLLGYCLK